MKTIFFLALALSFLSFAAPPEMDVIYGEDNRLEVYQVRHRQMSELARSTVAFIPAHVLKLEDGVYQVSGKTLQEKGICEKERFSKQPSVASCSGFLISPNLVATAGHCVKESCSSSKIVFDYRLQRPNGKIRIPESSVYECKRIVGRTLDPVTKQDFAVIELTSRVTDRAPLSLRSEGHLMRGEQVAVIGHPSGLPTKISGEATVRSLEERFFVANLDTYHGNSGSPVINVETGLVEGILVRGDTDYVRTPEGCQVSRVCENDGCRGEDVSYISEISELLQKK